MNTTEENKLDVRRLLCPMPVIKTQNAIKTMKPGELLLVVATDPGVKQDIPTWCRINGHHVMEILEIEHEFHVRIKVGVSK